MEDSFTNSGHSFLEARNYFRCWGYKQIPFLPVFPVWGKDKGFQKYTKHFLMVISAMQKNKAGEVMCGRRRSQGRHLWGGDIEQYWMQDLVTQILGEEHSRQREQPVQKAVSYCMLGRSPFCPEFVHTCLTTLSPFNLLCGFLGVSQMYNPPCPWLIQLTDGETKPLQSRTSSLRWKIYKHTPTPH